MLDRILIVDDEPLVLNTLADVLTHEGHSVSQATHATQALEVLSHEPHTLVLCDIRMPGMDGLTLLREIRRCHPGIDVLLMTGFGSLDGAIDAMTAGAADYLTKPLKPKEVVARIRAVLQRRQLEADLHALQSELRSRYELHNVVAISARMRAVVAALNRIKDGVEPVLVHGEAGSGRSFVARALHYNSPRRAHSFARVDCHAPPPGGLEAALFGAASSTLRRMRALCDSSAGGTLHVAGLEHCPRAAQLEIAACIATRTWTRRPDGASLPIETRLIFSTAQPVHELLEDGRLVPELAVLRQVATIHVPALRQRLDDLPGLAATFLGEYSREHGRSLRLGVGAGDLLAGADLPGNVAQLFAVLGHCATLSVDGVLSIENLERSLRQSNLSPDRPIADHLGDREYQLVLKAVQRNPGRLDQAARELGVSRTTLWRRMRKYGIKLAAT